MKRKSEDSDDCKPPAPKEQKTDADDTRSAATRFWMNQTLVGSQLALFLRAGDRAALQRCCKLQHANFKDNSVMNREYFDIPSAVKVPLHHEKGYDSFYGKIPTRINYLHIYADGDNTEMTKDRLLVVLCIIATRCRDVNILHLCRKPGLIAISLHSAAIPLTFNKLYLSTGIRYDQPLYLNGDNMINCIRASWNDIKTVDHYKMLQYAAITDSVALDIALYDTGADIKEEENKPYHWERVDNWSSETFVNRIVHHGDNHPFNGIKELDLIYGGVYANETCEHHLTAEMLHQLFPRVKHVKLTTFSDGATTRPLAWIQDDINYWLNCESIMIKIAQK